ncbi:MAG TPA: PEGA domain-containing protein [Terriglobia bacterium]|nr:PEGA domain-containing protein [Terriglobia bacterium]
MFRALPKPALALLIAFSLFLPYSIRAQQSRKPLTEAEVIDLLKNEVPSQRVESLVRQYGISFEMNDQTESALLVAGASDELLAALRELAPKPIAAPTLMIAVTPGGAQVFVDDELFAKTSSDGRLKIASLTPGPHRVRISLYGYRDYEQVYTLVAGQSVTASTTLQVIKKTDESSRAGNGKGSAAGGQISGSQTAARPQRVIIPAGTIITVRMVDDVDSSRDKAGKEFAAKVDAPITVGDQEIIPQDAEAHLRLLSVGNPSQPSLQLQLFTLTLNGKNLNVAATPYSKAADPAQKPAARPPANNARVGGILGGLAGGAAGKAISNAIGGNNRPTNTSGVQAPPQTLAADTKIDFTLRGPILVMQ